MTFECSTTSVNVQHLLRTHVLAAQEVGDLGHGACEQYIHVNKLTHVLHQTGQASVHQTVFDVHHQVGIEPLLCGVLFQAELLCHAAHVARDFKGWTSSNNTILFDDHAA